MDVRTQDAVERLMRDTVNMPILLDYIQGRRLVYLESLETYDPNDVTSIARTQGMVAALSEVLRIPAEAEHLKSERTSK